jgi:nucleoid DNA-binding protein
MRERLRVVRDELAGRVQQALNLPTKKGAEDIVNTVILCIEHTLLNNLRTNGFTMKLNSFGKFSARHRPGILRSCNKTYLVARCVVA